MEENKNIEEDSNPQQPNEDNNLSSNLFVETEQPKTNNEKQETKNEKQVTETMEVHTHPHTTHGKKTWKQYFWEFLMLFLAVFCGFLAEYQLEHKIEKDKEKQFMQSLMEDLHRDTLEIQETYDFGIKQKRLEDSLINVLNNDNLSYDNVSLLYVLNANSSRVVRVSFETRTSSQLKNAGGMRLLHNKKVTDSILGYWSNVDVCNNINDRLERLQGYRLEISRKIFHNKYYLRTDKPLAPISEIKEGVKLISNDPALLAEYSNIVYSRNRVLVNFLNNLTMVKAAAVRLMETINKEYHLK